MTRGSQIKIVFHDEQEQLMKLTASEAHILKAEEIKQGRIPPTVEDRLADIERRLDNLEAEKFRE